MILELRINNYRMFKNSNALSLSADTRIKKLGSNYFNILNRNVLKSIGLYGQNNIGKTNIVTLFKILKDLFLGKENLSFNRSFFGDTSNTDVTIIYKTNIDKNWIEYSFSYNSFSHEFIKENLCEVVYYETGNMTKKDIYIRDKEKGILTILGINRHELVNLFPSKKPFLYSVSLDNDIFSSLKQYMNSFIEFSNSLEIIELYNMPIEKTIEILKGNDEKKKNFVVEFTKHADLTINDFYYDENVIFKNDDESIKEDVLNKIDIIDQLRLFTKYGNHSVPSILFDSNGTKKIEAIASYIYESIIKGKTLIIDELDSGLHFKLSRAILSIFNSFSNLNGQMIFTAHDLELISCKSMMRKDQIYFTFRNDVLNSTLFCLKDYPVSEGGPRSAEDLIKHYNRGEIGYVPTPNFIKLLDGE